MAHRKPDQEEKAVEVDVIARLINGNRTLHMSKGAWSMACPVSDLPKWIALYRTLRDRGAKAGEPGPHAACYGPDVIALEKAEKLARVMGVL